MPSRNRKEAPPKDILMSNTLLNHDGISLNNDVLKNNNPFFIVENKLNITGLPVDKAGNKTSIDCAFVVKTVAKPMNCGNY